MTKKIKKSDIGGGVVRSNESDIPTYSMWNEVESTLIIRQVGSPSGSMLSGGEWRLYYDMDSAIKGENTMAQISIGSDGTGSYVLRSYPNSSIFISCTEAPDGHNKPAAPIEVELNIGGTTEYTVTFSEGSGLPDIG